MAIYSAQELKDRLSRLPRVPLAFLPTPLESCPRLSRALGGPSIWIKRDDQTGLAFGGNKVRHLEYLMAHVQAQGADSVIVGAGTQSNWCRQTAAAARKLGLDAYLVLSKGFIGPGKQGNLLLDQLMGVQVEIIEGDIGKDPAPIMEGMKAKASELSAQGRKPYILDLFEKDAHLAAASYVDEYLELRQQLEEGGLRADYLVLAAAGATQSGLALGVKAAGDSTRVIGFSPARWEEDRPTDIARIANRTAELLGIDVHLNPGEITNSDEQVGESYGILTPACVDALKLVATTESIFLDPVYTRKAMAGLIDWAREGKISADATVVFLHTGGTPALFAYAQHLLNA